MTVLLWEVFDLWKVVDLFTLVIAFGTVLVLVKMNKRRAVAKVGSKVYKVSNTVTDIQSLSV